MFNPCVQIGDAPFRALVVIYNYELCIRMIHLSNTVVFRKLAALILEKQHV